MILGLAIFVELQLMTDGRPHDDSIILYRAIAERCAVKSCHKKMSEQNSADEINSTTAKTDEARNTENALQCIGILVSTVIAVTTKTI